MNASIISGTRDAMSIVNKTHCFYFHSSSLVTMSQPCSIDNILLQSNCIPDFDCPVVRTGDEEVVVGCNDDSIDWALMFREMCNEYSFRMPVLECVRSVVVESEW